MVVSKILCVSIVECFGISTALVSCLMLVFILQLGDHEHNAQMVGSRWPGREP